LLIVSPIRSRDIACVQGPVVGQGEDTLEALDLNNGQIAWHLAPSSGATRLPVNWEVVKSNTCRGGQSWFAQIENPQRITRLKQHSKSRNQRESVSSDLEHKSPCKIPDISRAAATRGS